MALRPTPRQTEIGLLPGDWDTQSLGSLCKLINGRGFKPYEWRTSGLPIIRIQNLNGASSFNYFDGLYSKKLEVAPGQLLFAWSGSRGTSFGPHVWRGSLGLLNYHTWKVDVNDSRLNERFLLHALRQLTKYIEDHAHGAAALVHVQKWQMEEFVIPVPPVAEQESIADALSDTDALVESLQQLLAKKRQVKQGAMQELLTGKRRLPGFTNDWPTKPLGDLFSVGGGLSASRDQLSHQGHCYLHYGDIHASTRTFIDVRAQQQELPKLDIPLSDVSPSKLLEDGDVVFVDASEDVEGTSRHVVVDNPERLPFISGLHTIVAKGKTGEFHRRYRRYCFQTSAIQTQFRYYAVGTKVSGVSKGNIVKVTLPVPSVAEQAAIAQILIDMDAEIDALEAKLAKAHAIKQGMMQELLTGRIRLV